MECYQFLGDIFHFTNQYKESNEAYEKVLEFDPGNTYVLNNYAFFLAVRKEQLEKAKLMAEKCIQQETNNATYIDTYGYVLFRLGEYDKAQLQFARALEMDSKNVEYLEHYGDVLYHLNQVEQALDFWKQAKTNGSISVILDKKIQLKKYVE
jgi:Tfp pilus assembly protein PilF